MFGGEYWSVYLAELEMPESCHHDTCLVRVEEHMLGRCEGQIDNFECYTIGSSCDKSP
jgi:hypothetical protein